MRKDLKLLSIILLSQALFVFVGLIAVHHGFWPGHLTFRIAGLGESGPVPIPGVMRRINPQQLHSHIQREHRSGPNPSIAMGLAITSRNITTTDSSFSIPFLDSLLVSFCDTASEGFNYNFYLAYDHTDDLFNDRAFRERLAEVFYKYVENHCATAEVVRVNFVACPYDGKPAWAQNDAMIRAYLEGNDYFFRVNDDTKLETAGWADVFTGLLELSEPQNIGVVGPNHLGGNRRILTYDFVHRSHIEIFGFYYPRQFTSWYADRWVTGVYFPNSTTKVDSIYVTHTRTLGQRYTVQEFKWVYVTHIVEEDKIILDRYLLSLQRPQASHRRNKVISMVLWNEDWDELWGAVRNAQLRPVYYPDWTLRVYIVVIKPWTTELELAIGALRWLGAQVEELDYQRLPWYVPKYLWNYLVADDPTVDRFLIRRPTQRFSQRELDSVRAWLWTESPVHCIRDHKSHAPWPLVDGLWGARTARLKGRLGNDSLEELLTRFSETNKKMKGRDIFANSFLKKAVWDKVKTGVFCQDGVSCGRWPRSHGFRNKRPVWWFFVGQTWDAHEMPTGEEKTVQPELWKCGRKSSRSIREGGDR